MHFSVKWFSLLKFIASIEICFVASPMKNPAGVCHDKLKTDLPPPAFSSEPGECIICFIYLYIFDYTLHCFDRNATTHDSTQWLQ